MSWKQDLGGWTSVQDTRRRRREQEARDRMHPDGMHGGPSPGTMAQRHVSFNATTTAALLSDAMDDEAPSGGGFLPPGLSQRMRDQRLSSLSRAPPSQALLAPPTAEFSENRDLPSGPLDATAPPPPTTTRASQQPSPARAPSTLSVSRGRHETLPETSSAWVTVRGGRVGSVDAIVGTLSAAFGDITAAVVPDWAVERTTELYIRFSKQSDAHRAALTQVHRCPHLDVTLCLTWCDAPDVVLSSGEGAPYPRVPPTPSSNHAQHRYAAFGQVEPHRGLSWRRWLSTTADGRSTRNAVAVACLLGIAWSVGWEAAYGTSNATLSSVPTDPYILE